MGEHGLQVDLNTEDMKEGCHVTIITDLLNFVFCHIHRRLEPDLARV
jgi:hypothetical protein